MIRLHRVTAFCNWLDTIPPDPPFHSRAEFRFFGDLTDDEFDAAQAEMRSRGEAAAAEARALEAEIERRRREGPKIRPADETLQERALRLLGQRRGITPPHQPEPPEVA